MTLRDRFDQLRAGNATADELRALWLDASPVAVDAILGSWAGGDFANGHPASAMLDQLRWHGKRFNSALEAHPLICRDETGELYSETRAAGGGLASLWTIEVDGVPTATMVYDQMPVFDHFRAIDDDTLLGQMTGKLRAYFGTDEPYWFWLQRN